MRCAKLCIGLLVTGVAIAAILVWTGNVKAASLLSFAPLFLCPLMCLIPMMFGKDCKDGACRDVRDNPKNHS